LQTNDQANARSAQTGENSTGLQAIRNQYNKVAGDAVGGIIRQNQNNAAIQKSQWQQQAARSAIAQQQVQTQNYEMMTNAMNQADMARAQVLSSILGVGGMAAGMYAGSHHSRPPSAPRAPGGQMSASNMDTDFIA
jgi:exosome complex RNA-binding protein Csl4